MPRHRKEDNMMRGIECLLDSNAFSRLLFSLSDTKYKFFIFRCSSFHSKHIMPTTVQNKYIRHNEIKELSQGSILEMVLHIYPLNAKASTVETYEDFCNSECICCLIYYDCCFLDIYFKNTSFKKEILNMLRQFNAEQMTPITEESDRRTLLY